MADFDPTAEARSWALETVHDLCEARWYVDNRISYRDHTGDFARRIGHEALFLLGRIRELAGHDTLEALAEADGGKPNYDWLRKQRGVLVAAGSTPAAVDGMAVIDFAQAIHAGGVRQDPDLDVCAAAASTDGPGAIGEWSHCGKTHTGMQPTPWLLAEALFAASPRSLHIDEAYRKVVPDEDISDRDRPKNWQKKANKWFRENGLPVQISIVSERCTLIISEGSTEEPARNP